MRRLPSRLGRARAVRAAMLHALATCLVAACGVDQQASLGSVPQMVAPAAGAGASAGAGGGSGVAGSAGHVATEAGSQAPPPLPSLDAGQVDEPFVPPDAGAPPEPPTAAACAAPQLYAGDFACTLMMPFPGPPGSGPPPTMNATLAFGLAPSTDGVAADIVEGDFTFVAWDVAFMGRFEGQLDCVSGQFSARIVEGMTGAVFGMPMAFVGELEGMRVDAAGRLEGSWWHGPAQDPANGCTGPWSATLQ